MGSNPAAPTIFSFENKGKPPAAELAPESRNGTEGRRPAEIGTESPEKSPNSVPSLFSDRERFDWNNDPAVAIAEQPRTAIYWNPCNQLVIRQERSPLEEDDHFVYFAIESLPTLIRELQSYLP